MKKLISSLISLGLAGAPVCALAAELSGQSPVVCAVHETYDCASARQCIADSPESINIPSLIRIDFAAKKAFTKTMSGEERLAAIDAQQVVDQKLILQGVQGGYGWSMAISRETGAMALTIAGDGAGFAVFGTCMSL